MKVSESSLMTFLWAESCQAQ